MKKWIVTLFFGLFIFIYGEVSYIASFNTLHLGWREDKDYETMAEFIDFFDLIVLQEVMNEEGLRELTEILNDESVSSWEYLISETSTGRGDYREYYGYLWKKERAELLRNEGYYRGNEAGDFERLPHGATFRMKNFDFTIINVHLVYGDSISRRRREALNLHKVYDYYQALDEEEKDIIIAGDFNLPAYDESFEELIKHEDMLYYGINPSNKTTIGKTGPSNSYDNIFYSHKYTSEFTGNSGIIDYTNGEYQRMRREISDHLPVFIEVKTTKDDD